MALVSVKDVILISFSGMWTVMYDVAMDSIMLRPTVRSKDAIAAVESAPWVDE
jgi:hypothetical protein